MNLLDRLMSKTLPEPNSGCWLWSGSVSWDGYGQIREAGRTQKTHRVSYVLHCGEIPEGMVVRHRCDMPSCLNPGHLVLGTQFDNIGDREERKRTARGERCSKAKLTAEQVREIRASNDNKDDLARKYGVSESTIRHTRERRYWSHI